MSYIVRHRPNAQTGPAYESFDVLDEAVARIEALHSESDVAEAELFRQVSVRVERVVKVTIEDEPDGAANVVSSAAEASENEPQPPTAPPPGAMPLTAATVSGTNPVTPSEESRKGRFSR